MTAPNEELINNLTIKAGVMEMGEKIALGSDTALMRQAAATLQSQAECIATLEVDVEYLQEDIDAMCNAIPGYHWSGGAAELIAECFAERDTLRAQLAEIAATEPVATINDLSNSRMFTLEANGYSRKDKLFTRPMPAQDVTGLVDALEKLARLGNGEYYGNSDGNMIARDALSKYKGVK